jgi:hypothetical protein
LPEKTKDELRGLIWRASIQPFRAQVDVRFEEAIVAERKKHCGNSIRFLQTVMMLDLMDEMGRPSWLEAPPVRDTDAIRRLKDMIPRMNGPLETDVEPPEDAAGESPIKPVRQRVRSPGTKKKSQA